MTKKEHKSRGELKDGVKKKIKVKLKYCPGRKYS